MVKEYNISYAVLDGFGGKVEGMVIFPSLLKVLWWFLRKGRKCCEIYIWTSYKSGDERRLFDDDP